MSRWWHSVSIAMMVGVVSAVGAIGVPRAHAASCASISDAEQLNSKFDGGIDGLAGGDYQRSYALPDGRNLWMLQDAFVVPAGGNPTLVHNVGLIQTGSCFALLHGGNDAHPEPWIGAGMTKRFHRWLWALGGAASSDGTFHLFLAEMRELGPRYLSKTEPVATWLATIDLHSLTVTSLEPPPDSSPALYGWSVVVDRRVTYLYGHCYRQFGFSVIGHDTCTADVTVARTRDLTSGPLEYWDGRQWSNDATRAANIAPRTDRFGHRREINPMQIAHIGGRWIAVTKDGDWWGSVIYLDSAPTPTGPWTNRSSMPARPLGASSDYNTYFASFIAGGSQPTIGLSNNRWDGALSPAYRPTFLAVPLGAWSPIAPVR